MREYSCSSCSFQVRSDDESEVVDHVREHAEQRHDMDLSEDAVREGMREVEPEAGD
jgi:predicted small metal-binding protein